MTWDEQKIGEICDTGSGGTPSRQRANDFYGGVIPWVKSGELRESIITSTSESLTELGLASSSAKVVPRGAVLVAMYGATVGRVGILGIEAATNQAICHIVPRNGQIDTRYLFHSLQFKLPEFLAQSVGGAQPNISQEIIRNTKIPLPPMEEQRRIAAILDRAESLRAKRRQATAKLDTFTQSLFLEMFGDPAANPKHWPTAKMGEVVAEFRYGTSNKASLSNGRPALRIPNVVGGTLNLEDLKTVPVDEAEFERLRLHNNDLLLVRTNGNKDYVGRCALYDCSLTARTGYEPTEFIYASYLIRARLIEGKIEPAFLRDYLLGAEGRRQLLSRSKTSAGQFNINTDGLSKIPLLMPPISLQKEYVVKVKKALLVKNIFSGAEMKIVAINHALQSRAFRGEL